MKYVRYAAFLVCALLVSSAAHAADIRTVILSGQQAPGMPDGVLFRQQFWQSALGSTRFQLALNDAGQTAFRASLTGSGVNSMNDLGIWSEGSGTLALVARTGSQAPGAPNGVTFVSVNFAYDLVLNDAGQTAFFARVSTVPSYGLWSEDSGSLALVARSGDPAPELPSGVNFGADVFIPHDLLLNDAGQTAFIASLTGSGVDATNGRGIWSGDSGSLALIARLGDHAAGTPSGVSYRDFGFGSSPLPPVLNDFGNVAFFAIVTGSGVDSTNDEGIWSDRSGSVGLVAREGDHAPGTLPGVQYSTFHFFFDSPVLNNVGETAFRAALIGSGVDATNDEGIWSEGSGTLALVAREGDHAPGTSSGVNYGTPSGQVLNNAGQTAFRASLTGSGVDFSNDAGIWLDDSGNLMLIARDGDHAVGTPSGVNFNGFSSSPVLNDAGQIAFRAALTGSGVDFKNDNGIWATDRTGDLQLIAREGDLLEVAPGDFRVISGFTRPLQGDPTINTPTGNSDGRRSGFNNVGQLAFLATFTDGTSGIFVSNRVAVPEPSTLLLLGFGSLAVLWRRRGLVCASILAAFVCTAMSAHAAEFRTVALSGQQAPGLPDGVNFGRFDLSLPVLNDAGQTAFYAPSGTVGSIPDGIWSEGSGSLALVARNGQQIPGMPDGVYFGISESFGRPVINDAGQTMFRASVQSLPAIWSDRFGSLELVARSGDHAPGTPDDVYFSRTFTNLVLNNAGQTAFWASPTVSGVQSGAAGGIWSEGSASLALVARNGDRAPGTASGVNFSSIGSGSLVLNDSGHTAFVAGLIGGDSNSTNASGIWSDRSGILAVVARKGDQAPGTPSGVNFNNFTCCTPVLNNAGHMAIRASLTGSGVDTANNQGIWSERSGSMGLVARTGEQAPGAPSGVNFSSFSQALALNDSDHTAFYAVLSGSGVDSTSDGSLWSESSGSLALVAREGDHAPGTPSGVVFSSLVGSDRLVLNEAGQIAFFGSVSGNGVDLTNGDGIWATDRSRQLQLIARKGDLLEVAPGDFRTISDGRPFSGSTGNSDGRPSFFNNRGQLAFRAQFTDGTSGIFVSNRVAVPEPSTLLLVRFGSLAVLWRRRGLVCAAVLVVVLASPAATLHADDIRTVALSGQHAPGTPDGVNFNNFNAPVLNDAGQTAFLSYSGASGLNGNFNSLWSEGSGSLALVARSGHPAPGMPDGVSFAFYSGYDKLVLNNAGQTIFLASLTGPGVSGANDDIVWSDPSGSLSPVAREGDPATGTASGVIYNHVDSFFQLNDAGQSAFQADLAGSGVGDSNDRGIWLRDSGSAVLVAREGMAAPGLPSGVNLISIGPASSMVLNGAGQIAFRSGLTGTGPATDGSIWLAGSGGLALVAREGSQAPGTPSGANFETALSIALALNDAGHTAFASRLTGSGVDLTNNGGIWSDRFGSLSLVARNGDQAPDAPPGVRFTGFGNSNLFALNDADQMMFMSGLTGSGVDSTNNVGIWSDRSGRLVLVARKGDHAPGTPNGIVFGGFLNNFTVLNSTGQSAFYASLTENGVGVGGGWWATDRNGNLQLIARSGDLLEVAPGDVRTIAIVYNFPWSVWTGNSDGRASFFNNRGQLAFAASFTDGSSGIFVSNRVAIPEPSTFVLAAVCVLGLIVRPARRNSVRQTDARVVRIFYAPNHHLHPSRRTLMKRLMFSAFATIMVFACDHAKAESIASLYSSGMSDAVTPLPDTAIDPHYTFTQVPAGSGFGPNTYVVDSSLYPLATDEWMANSSTSKWISAQADQTTFLDDPGNGNYVFRTTFDLTGFDPASAQISGQWSIDDFGLDILINGVSTGNTHSDYSQTPIFQTFKSFSIDAGFVAGLNSLDFLVRNEPYGGGINPMGLRVEVSGTANPIPEPATLALAAVAGCGLITSRRRRAT